MMVARRGDMAKPTSAFTPASVAGLTAWYDAGAIVGLANADPVPTWADLSGNGYDAVQATGSKQPSYRTSVIDGRPVIRFDGVDDFLRIAHAFSNTSGGSMSMFIVAKAASAVSTELIGTRGAPTSVGFIVRTSTTGSLYGHIGGTNQTDTFTPTSFHLIEVIRANLNIQLGHDGILPSAVANTVFNPNTTYDRTNLGGNSSANTDAPAVFGASDIAEVIVYETALSGTNIDLIESYLAARYPSIGIV